MLVNRSGIPYIITVVYFVDPSVVIAIHSKDVFVLSEELFQLSGFSVTEVRLGRCNHVL